MKLNPLVISLLFSVVAFDSISWNRMHETLPVVVSGLGSGISIGLLISIWIVKKYKLQLVNPLKDLNLKWFISSGIITLVVAATYIDVFVPCLILFSNDGPLGVMNSEALNIAPGTGYWVDTHWIGYNGGVRPVTLTSLITWVLGPLYYAKFYASIVSIFAGICGLVLCRTLGMRYSIATLLGVGAALNSNFLSNAAWGVGSRSTTLGFLLLSLACIHTSRGVWIIRYILAGACLGMCICEGADNGVIMCLLFAAYFMFKYLYETHLLSFNLSHLLHRIRLWFSIKRSSS